MTEQTTVEPRLVFPGSATGACLPTKAYKALSAEAASLSPAHVAVLEAQANRQCAELQASRAAQ